MSKTTIDTQDIRNKAVTSIKIQDNPSFINVTVNNVRTTSDFVSVLDAASAGKPVAMSKLVVSGDYSSGYSNLPTPSGSAYIEGDMRIEGDLTVNGTTTTINTATLNISDNIIVLNNDYVTGVPSEDAGIQVRRGASPSTSLLWNEGSDYWTLTNNGTSFYRIVDENYADGRYAKINGNNFTGNVGVGITNPVVPLHIVSPTPDIYLCGSVTNQVDSGTIRFLESNTAANWQGAFIRYDGSSNKFYIGTHEAVDKLLSSDIDAITIDRANGNIIFSGDISLSKTNATVDGVNIPNHNANGIINVKHVTDAMLAALVGTNGSPSSTNKYVTNSDPRLTDARVAVAHGNEKHSALPYYDSINGKTSSTILKNISITGTGGTTVTTSNNASYAAIINIDSSHNHNATYVSLTSSTPQVIKSAIVIGESTAQKDLVIHGNLTIAGTTTSINTETLNIYDNILTLNSNYIGSTPTENAGLEVNRGTLAKTSIQWDETNDYWVLTNDGANYYRVVDENHGDSRYVKVTGDKMIGGLENKITFNPSYPTPGLVKGNIHLNSSGTNGYSSAMTFGSNSGSTVDSAQAGIYVQGNGTYGTHMYLATSNAHATGSQVRMTITSTGNVGIGITTPTESLHVVGKSRLVGDTAVTGTFIASGTISESGSLLSSIYAKLVSPTFTGTPTSPTAAAGNNTTQVATTSFVTTAVTNKTTITGNAGSATKLATARSINGVLFDGTANITIEDSTKEPTFTKNTGFNKAFGTTAGTVTQGNDSRLSDTRVPVAHSHTKANITDFPLSLPANGGDANTSKHLVGDDTRSVNSNPSEYMSGGSRFASRAGWQTEFKNVSTVGLTGLLNGTYCYLQTHTPWSDPSGGYPIQTAYGNGIPCWRVGVSDTTWSNWQALSDGGTATTLNGLTATVAELNYVGGVTSNIQTQINSKAGTSHGNHVPTTQTANNAVFLRNDNSWQTITPTNIGSAAVSHAHGNISDTGAIGLTTNLMIQTTTGGVLTAKSAGTTAQYLRGDGSWATPPNTNTITTIASGTNISVTGSAPSYTINHGTISAPTSSSGSGRTYLTGLTSDGYGHITGYTTATESVTDTNTASAVSNILEGSNSGTAITYAPYALANRGAGKLYIGATNPTNNTRLNYDGYLYATKLYSGGVEVLTSVAADKYLSGVSGTCGGNITFTVANGTNAIWNSAHIHANDHASGSDIQNLFVNIANSAGTTQFSAGSATDSLRFAVAGNNSIGFTAATKTITITGAIANEPSTSTTTAISAKWANDHMSLHAGTTIAKLFTFNIGSTTSAEGLWATGIVGDYVVILTCNSPERHPYYVKNGQSVSIHLDDAPYTGTIEVSAMVIEI